MLLYIASAIVSIQILLLLSSYYPPTRIYIIIPYFFLGVGIYAGLLVLLGDIRKADIDFFLHTINPREMWRYVRDEVRGKHKEAKG